MRKFSIKFYLNRRLKCDDAGRYAVYMRIIEGRKLHRCPCDMYMTDAEFLAFDNARNIATARMDVGVFLNMQEYLDCRKRLRQKQGYTDILDKIPVYIIECYLKDKMNEKD